ncbi:hypothetical protein CKAN_00415300 [Cinnamomum micranthum f. kanehirae]|uniref:Uncharacterized protein n=1 Tax=Cinnamomum micranthum f. kanehirae TaxID=337451 RepID=A0A443NB57_9MAGN|nr:hypothetical protein CKAN_00415300 [Cinnamomum micranthum f. kanehirae]
MFSTVTLIQSSQDLYTRKRCFFVCRGSVEDPLSTHPAHKGRNKTELGFFFCLFVLTQIFSYQTLEIHPQLERTKGASMINVPQRGTAIQEDQAWSWMLGKWQVQQVNSEF